MLIKENGVIPSILVRSIGDGRCVACGFGEDFYYSYTCVIEGEVFLFGSYEKPGKIEKMIHRDTTLTAVDWYQDLKCLGVTGKPDPEKMLKRYFEKLETSKHNYKIKSTPELILRAKSIFILPIEVWKTNLLLSGL